MGLDLIRECQKSLALVQEDAEDGILYMDAGAAEAFHFSGGLPSLFELGVRAICSLEQASPFDAAVSWRGPESEPVETAVILTSRLLTESHSDVVRCLLMHSSLKRCTIWTSISEEAHSGHPDTSFGLAAFHDYQNSLIRDLGKPSVPGEGERNNAISSQRRAPHWEAPHIEVKHFPMMVCPFTRSVFVLPSGGSVAKAPLSDRGDARAVSRGLPGIDVISQTGGEERIPAGATLLAHCLHHVAAQMDLKCEIFTLGPLAHAVGKVMSGLPSPPEGIGHPRRPAGLIVVDRSEDLITPSCHGDSLLDRVFSSVPSRAVVASDSMTSDSFRSMPSLAILRPCMDLRMPLDPNEDKLLSSGVCFPSFPGEGVVDDSNSNRESGESGALGTGSVTQPSATKMTAAGAEYSLNTSWDQKGLDYLEALMGKRLKDSVLLIRKWLQEALRQEKVSVGGKGRLGAVNVNELRSLRRALSEKPEIALRHTALIQIARATELALGQQQGSRWDALVGAERILVLSAGDSTQSLALQLQDIVQQCVQNLDRLSRPESASSAGDLLSLRDALTLAIVGYGLAGQDMHSDDGSGPFTWEEEQALKEAVVNAILQGSPAAPMGFLRGLEGALTAILKEADTGKGQTEDNSESQQSPSEEEDAWDPWAEKDSPETNESEEESEEYGEVQLKLELRDRVEDVFGIFHRVATACSQSSLRKFPTSVDNETNGGEPRTGLIHKLLSLTLSKTDIPGLERHVSGMVRFLKGGLGRLGLRQATPKLSDQKTLLIFVIGGLNFAEVREAREAQAAAPGGQGVEVLLGATTMITPSDMYDLLLGSCGSV